MKLNLAEWIINRFARRFPDVIIGGVRDPYLLRWWVIPRNPMFNIYLHRFMRSDDDRALHDHPWVNLSILLRGEYVEYTIRAGGVAVEHLRCAGDWRFRLSGRIAHRIELTNGHCWTLFITGPRYREWGFHCPRTGWVHWKKFSDPDDSHVVGRGCDQ